MSKNKKPVNYPALLDFCKRLADVGISPGVIKGNEKLLTAVVKHCRTMPEIKKQETRIEQYYCRWQNSRRWLELRIIIGDFGIVEFHLIGANGNKMSFRTFVNDISDEEVEIAFKWLEPTLNK